MKKMKLYYVFYEYPSGNWGVYECLGLQAAHQFYHDCELRTDIVRAKLYRPCGSRMALRQFDRRDFVQKKDYDG